MPYFDSSIKRNAKTMTLIKATTRKSTSLLKKLLKDKFNIKTSVRSEFYSMGCSLNVEYALGADQKEVESLVKRLQNSGFDSMTDSSYRVDNEGIVVDGFELESFKHVFVSQTLSTELKYRLAQMISDNMKFEGVTELASAGDMNKLFEGRAFDSWNWNDLLYKLFRTRNFATQDENAIVLKSVHHSEKNFEVYFIYEVDGVTYNTEVITGAEVVVEEKEVAAAPAATEPVKVVTGEVSIISYSEKAIAVIGDTKPIKDKLKELGGKWNNRLTCGPGWIFPKTKLETLTASLRA